MNLFIDDKKDPSWYNFGDSGQVVVSRTGENGIHVLRTAHEKLDTLYLDHDLGDGMSGYTFLDTILKEGIIPKKVVIISLNIVGIRRLRDLCGDYGLSCQIGGFPNVPIIGNNIP